MPNLVMLGQTTQA